MESILVCQELILLKSLNPTRLFRSRWSSLPEVFCWGRYSLASNLYARSQENAATRRLKWQLSRFNWAPLVSYAVSSICEESSHTSSIQGLHDLSLCRLFARQQDWSASGLLLAWEYWTRCRTPAAIFVIKESLLMKKLCRLYLHRTIRALPPNRATQ
jgi:hypothetical protein